MMIVVDGTAVRCIMRVKDSLASWMEGRMGRDKWGGWVEWEGTPAEKRG